MFCTLLDHRVHNYVSLSEEFGQDTSVLSGTEGRINQMIQERRAKMQDLRHTSKLNKEATNSKAAVGLQVFIDLKQILEKGMNYLIHIKIRQTTAEQLTDCLIAELGQQVKVLMQSSADVQQLSLSDDHLHVLQSFSSVNNISAMKDRSKVGVQLPLYEEMVRKAVVEAVGHLQTTFRQANNKLLEEELKRMKMFK
ncbi:hypothetical protein ILYODFUR_018998, partial [Ilyodon furcidens]